MRFTSFCHQRSCLLHSFPPISVSQLCTNFPPILSVHLFLQVSWKRHRRLRCLRFRRSLHQNTYFPHFHFLHTRVLWRIIMFNYSFITYDNQGNKSMVRIVRIEHNTLIQQRREREREKKSPERQRFRWLCWSNWLCARHFHAGRNLPKKIMCEIRFFAPHRLWVFPNSSHCHGLTSFFL